VEARKAPMTELPNQGKGMGLKDSAS
jgi:hypothetical protein